MTNEIRKFIKLTNASSVYKGEPLLINTIYVKSIYSGPDGTTYLHAGDNMTWEVEETLDTVFNLLKPARVPTYCMECGETNDTLYESC